MILYHSTNQEIDRIDLSVCKPNKDFGQGFYLTDIEQQAQLMAKRRTRIMGQGSPTVLAFEFDERLLDDPSLLPCPHIGRFRAHPAIIGETTNV
ncbi:DUF3990 domain-containing protein [Parabacteroides sp.]